MRLAHLGLAATLALAFALPAATAGAKGKAAAKGPDPFEAWLSAEQHVEDGKPAEALIALRRAVGDIERLDEKAQVGGPKGASWSKAEALFRYRMRAGDVATMVDYRDAVPLYEGAAKVAPDKEKRREAKAKLAAAEANVKAGVKTAPGFMGDDYGDIVDGARAPPPPEEEKKEPGAAKGAGEKSWEEQIASDPRD